MKALLAKPCRATAWTKVLGVALLLFANALSLEVGVGVGLSTLGFNFHLGSTLNPFFGGEVDFSFVKFGREGQIELNDQNLDFDVKAQMAEIGALAHFHPFKGSFRLTAGIYGNENKIRFDVQPKDEKLIGALKFSAEEQGKLETTFDYPNAAPYLGLGFGRPAGVEGTPSFLIDLGVIYHGPPRVRMKGTGLIAPTAENASVLQETFAKHTYTHFYPILAIGIGLPAF